MDALFPDLQPDPPVPEKPVDAPPWQHVNRTQLAALLGVHPETVTSYVRNGMPVESQGRGRREAVYDAVACLRWWRGAQVGPRKASAKDDAHEQALLAKAELDKLRADQLKRELIPIGEAVEDMQTFAKGVEAQVRAIPRRARQSGVIFDAQQEKGLTDLCRQVCSDIAQWRTRQDAETATKVPA